MSSAKKVTFDAKTHVSTFVKEKEPKERKRVPREPLKKIPFDDLIAMSKKDRSLAIAAMVISDKIKFYTGINSQIGKFCLYFSHAAFSEFVRSRAAIIRENPRFELHIFKSGVLQFAIEDAIISFIRSANRFAVTSARTMVKLSDIKALVDTLHDFNNKLNIPQFDDIDDDGDELDSTDDAKKSPIQTLAGKPVVKRLAYAAGAHIITTPSFKKLHDIITSIVDAVLHVAFDSMADVKTLSLEHCITALNYFDMNVVNADDIFRFKDEDD